MNSNKLHPNIECFLPHRGTMLLLNGVAELSTEHAQVLSHAAIQSWYLSESGGMPAWIGIELMAQAIAVHVGWSKMQQGKAPAQGVLLGTRKYHTEQPEFTGPLVVEARVALMNENGMGAYDCAIFSRDQCVATAVVKVFEPEDFQTFLRSQLEGA